MTCLQKQEDLYYDHELCQFANWFKCLLNSIGYEFIDEVQFIQYRDKFNEEDAVYSSEDLQFIVDKVNILWYNTFKI